MKQTLIFNVSTIGSTASKLNVDAFDESLDAYEHKNYLQSFHNLLDYINPELRTKYGNPEGTDLSIPHGSVVVNIKIEGDQLIIRAPFLSLPVQNRIPLLRQVGVLNFSHIDMAQIELKDGRLQFEYTCPLALVNPYKIYYVLKEICITGDKYDDEFATKFGAERIYEPKIRPYDAQTVDTVYETIQSSCVECLEGMKFFEAERKYGYAWNVVACTILKVLYYAHPQGQLMNDLDKAVTELDREDIPLPEIVAIGKKAVERLQNMTKEELAEDLYFVETFVSSKRRSSLKNIQENFEDTYEKTTGYMSSEDYKAVCVMVTYQFYNMYYYNDVQDDVNNVVVSAMMKSSNKSWEEAAPILHTAMGNIMEGNLTVNSNDMADYMAALQQGMQSMNVKDVAKNIQGMFSSLFGGKK